MFLYKFGYGSYEESRFSEILHEKEFSNTEFETIVEDAIIRVLNKIALGEIDPRIYSEPSYEDIHDDVLQELLNIGFKKVEYKSQWSCFGWPSLIDEYDWKGDRGSALDKIYKKIPKDLKEKIKIGLSKMTRTRRIYNRRPIEGGPGFKGWMRTEIREEILKKNPSKFYNESIRPEDDIEFSQCPWVTYHPYRQLCCGHCKRCKDHEKNKRERMSRKAELRNRIKEIRASFYMGNGKFFVSYGEEG